MAGEISMLRASQGPRLGSRLRGALALLRRELLAGEPSAATHRGVPAHQRGAAVHDQQPALAADDPSHLASAREGQRSAGFASPALCDDPENDSAPPAAADSSLSSSAAGRPRHRSLQGDSGGGGGGGGDDCAHNGAWQARSLPLAGERGVLPPAITAAAAIMLAADPAEAAEGFGPVVSAMRLIDGLHSATGLPWWATFAAAAAGAAAAVLVFPICPTASGLVLRQPSTCTFLATVRASGTGQRR